MNEISCLQTLTMKLQGGGTGSRKPIKPKYFCIRVSVFGAKSLVKKDFFRKFFILMINFDQDCSSAKILGQCMNTGF